MLSKTTNFYFIRSWTSLSLLKKRWKVKGEDNSLAKDGNYLFFVLAFLLLCKEEEVGYGAYYSGEQNLRVAVTVVKHIVLREIHIKN